MILIDINAEKMKEIEEKHFRYTKELVRSRISEKLEEIEHNFCDEYGQLFVEFLKQLLDESNLLLKKIILMDKEKLIDFPNSIKEDASFEFIHKYLDFYCSIKRCEDKINIYKSKIPDFRRKNKKQILDKVKELCQQIQEFASNYNIEFEQSCQYKNKDQFIKDLNNLKKSITDKISPKINPVKEYLLEIFDYDSFVKEDDKWSAYLFTSEMDISVCPYCNRNYINTTISEKGKARPEIDHFYPKSIYPFFALTLYNFIPCCHTCNSKKREKDTVKQRILYPYLEQFGENVRFIPRLYTEKDLEKSNKLSEEDLYDIKFFFGNSDNFKVEIEDKNEDINKKEKIKNSNKTFLLEDFYQFHKKDVRNIIKKAIIYNQSRIEELYKNYCPDLFESEEEIVQMIFPNYYDGENLDNKEILSKLRRDIYKDLGIWR